MAKVEDLIDDLKQHVTIALVTHNMQQAARCAGQVAFFYLGELVEFGPAAAMFTAPRPEVNAELRRRQIRLKVARNILAG